MIGNRILVILLIIVLLVAYSFVLGSPKICIRMKINKPYINMKEKLEKVFLKVLTRDGQIEYEDDDFIILGGNTMLLPGKKENINVQVYLRGNESGCTFVLGYPALPLESY